MSQTMELLNLKAAALIEINMIRAAYGVAPLVTIPRGRCSDTQRCPLYHALADCGVTAVNPFSYVIHDHAIALPRILLTFMRAVDYGRFPELTLRNEQVNEEGGTSV